MEGRGVPISILRDTIGALRTSVRHYILHGGDFAQRVFIYDNESSAAAPYGINGGINHRALANSVRLVADLGRTAVAAEREVALAEVLCLFTRPNPNLQA